MENLQYNDVQHSLLSEISWLVPLKKKVKLTNEILSHEVDIMYAVKTHTVFCRDSETDEIAEIRLDELGLDDLFGILNDLRSKNS